MKLNKILSFIIVIAVLLIAGSIGYLLKTNIGYSDGIEGKQPVKGTYIVDNDDVNSTYLSIDFGEGTNEFYYFKADNRIIKSGTIQKTNENYYILYDKSTNAVYGKIIPSYKKIYLIDTELNIVELEYYSQQLIYPAF